MTCGFFTMTRAKFGRLRLGDDVPIVSSIVLRWSKLRGACGFVAMRAVLHRHSFDRIKYYNSFRICIRFEFSNV